MLSAGDTPAVLFYLLDRHALLAMTMGSKCVFLNSLTTPGCAHPSAEGNLVRTVAEKSSPLRRGGTKCRGGYCGYRTPPVVQSMPPALEPPTQTMFARGPVGGGHSGMLLLMHSLSPVIPA